MTEHIKYLALNQGYDRVTRARQIQRAAKFLTLYMESPHADQCPNNQTTGLPGAEMAGTTTSLLRTAQRMYLAAQ